MQYFSFSWRVGYIIDGWTLVHFLSGVLVAFVGEITLLTYRESFLVGVTLFIAWEIFEKIRGIKEPFSNRVSDILVALVGLSLFFWLAYKYPDLSVIIGLTVVALLPLLSFFGWRSYLLRTGKRAPENVKEVYHSIKEDISDI